MSDDDCQISAAPMTERYFVDRPIEGLQAELRGAEAHHAAHVMRMRVGDELTLFDGSGAEFSARVERVGRAEVELAILSRAEIERELPIELTLAVALPKGDRQKWLVEKAVELGVARIVPLTTERANASPSSGALERLRRAVVEASKQCGRNRLLEIGEPAALAEYVSSSVADAVRWIAHPGGRDCDVALKELACDGRVPRAVVLAIGPEGGFAPAEIALAETSGWQVVGLGARKLRVETAALALAAAVMIQTDKSNEQT